MVVLIPRNARNAKYFRISCQSTVNIYINSSIIIHEFPGRNIRKECLECGECMIKSAYRMIFFGIRMEINTRADSFDLLFFSDGINKLLQPKWSRLYSVLMWKMWQDSWPMKLLLFRLVWLIVGLIQRETFQPFIRYEFITSGFMQASNVNRNVFSGNYWSYGGNLCRNFKYILHSKHSFEI